MNLNTLKNAFPRCYFRYVKLRTGYLARRFASDDPAAMEANLRRLYRRRQGRALRLNPPVTYTEKIQWRKLHGLTPLHSRLSDKLAVRDWVAERIGEAYLIPLLGAWDSFGEIPIDALPDSFVLKTNNASSANIIVPKKEGLNYSLAKQKFDHWLRFPYWYAWGYEMQYAAIRPKILAEAYLGEDLWDYKFLCFGGKVCFIWVDTGRGKDHKRHMFCPDWTPAPFNQKYPVSCGGVEKPGNLKHMIALAETLSAGFDHVRVDLYNCSGRSFFGEMTFTNGSGFEPILPGEWDEKLGRMWDIGNG